MKEGKHSNVTVIWNLPLWLIVIQGISYWSVKSNSALMGRRINHFIELWFIVGSGGLEIWVSSTSFQKSNIDWPQQPPKGKVLKFNMIFHYSTKKLSFSKHQCRAEFKNLDDSEVLSSDFPGLNSSAASMTSVASTASMASTTLTASFYQKTWGTWCFHQP